MLLDKKMEEMMLTMNSLTKDSSSLFLDLARDAGNWSGTPLFEGDKADRGNLTDLKRKGLVKTDTEDGCTWVHFTEYGREFAKFLGVDL